MPGLTPTTTGVGLRVIGWLLALLNKPLGRWWKRRRLAPASGEKLSVLVARISGDVNYTHVSISEAIRSGLPEVSVFNWPEELPSRDGDDSLAYKATLQTARSWLREKNCDVLIAGRMKSSNVVSLKFIPVESKDASPDKLLGGKTYTLSEDTMDLPIRFVDDLVAGIAACTFAYVERLRVDGFVPAIRRTISQIEKIKDSPEFLVDPLTEARLINCYAVGRGMLFEHTGVGNDLELASQAFERGYQLLDKDKNPLEWSKLRANFGTATARLGGISVNIAQLEQGAEAVREALQRPATEVREWTRKQLSLAFIYSEISRIKGEKAKLQQSIELCHALITDELRDLEPILWGGVQYQYATALVTLSDMQAGDDALARAMEAFSQALEVWGPDFPILRASTLINLSLALMNLASRQNNLVWFHEAIGRLRDAEQLVSAKDNLRIWLLIRCNLGVALSLLIAENPDTGKEAVKILRDAKKRATGVDDSFLLSRISVNLARAIMLLGEHEESSLLLKESVVMFEELKQTDDQSLRYDILNNLGSAYRIFGVLDENEVYLQKSREVLEDLLSKTDGDSSLFLIFRTQQSLGQTLRELGKNQRSTELLNDSVHVLSEGLNFTSQENSPLTWSTVQLGLAQSYFELAKLDPKSVHLEHAQDALSNSLPIILGPSAHGGPLMREAQELSREIAEFAEREAD